MEKMRIYTLSSKDEVHRYKKSIVVDFAGRRKVLSTAPLNGGYQTELTGVFNNDGNPGAGMSCVMRAPTYEEHMAIIAEKDLGLDPRTVCGIGTAASMDNAVSYTHLDVYKRQQKGRWSVFWDPTGPGKVQF